ncbi:indc11 [Verticillium alfalfae VaMs.102]|uniref:Indc11 n=1 Tax=Verticillium alfalfae (strain VaMs.102 / ATCC MYA-4576 / FGSC 10136) TaxID=526221 RepID=C9SKY3_VERA1|nr:indc11 [Verticillium alfalfae VaMs.102]EEY19351.1 indc11 [Verticillium alfalfae VaMs.102]
MTTIRRALISGFGDASNVKIVTETIDAPGKNEVQVDVIYSGFSGADINMRLGVYPQQKTAPLYPGYCFVGRVAVNGRKSNRFRPGDLVGAVTVYDSEADKINVEEKYLVAVPPGVDTRSALAAVLDWNTAYGLVHRATTIVGQGKRIFIHGLSGAVGYATMTLCLLGGGPKSYGDGVAYANHEALAGPWGVHAIRVHEQGVDGRDGGRRGGCTRRCTTRSASRAMTKSWGDFSPAAQRVAAARTLSSGQERVSVDEAQRGVLLHRRTATRTCRICRPSALLAEGKFEVPIKKIWDLDNIREPHAQWTNVTGMGSCLIRVDQNA